MSLPAVVALFCTAIVTNWGLAAIGASAPWYRRWFKAINEGNELRALLNEAEEYVADACDAMEHTDGRDLLNRINAALEARGLEIREKGQ